MFTKQTMDTGDADVEEPVNCVAHYLERDAGFLRDGQVGRTSSGDQDCSPTRLHIALAVRDRTC